LLEEGAWRRRRERRAEIGEGREREERSECAGLQEG